MGILSRDGLGMAMDFGRFLVSALMIFKLLMVVTGSEKPVVVVTSGSMEPAFQRGDLLVIYKSEDPIRAGEIILFNLQGREIPIVHRVIKLHEEWDTGEVNILTKGDKNYVDDSFVYPRGQLGIKRENVVGRIVGVVDTCLGCVVGRLDFVHDVMDRFTHAYHTMKWLKPAQKRL